MELDSGNYVLNKNSMNEYEFIPISGVTGATGPIETQLTPTDITG